MRLKHYIMESEDGFKLNCANLPLSKARKYTEDEFNKANKDVDELLPNFDKNYMMLQNKCKHALDIPRIQMPVIEPTDMKKFHEDLVKGRIDIFKPLAGGKEKFAPKNWKPMTKKQGESWVKLGLKDGDLKDDIVDAKWTSIPGKDLKPIQSQIWLEKLIKNIIKFGVPKAGSPVLSTTIIVSVEGYILDGHHRFGQVMLANPKLKMDSLMIPLDIDLLLKLTRTYGAALQNKPKG